MTGDSQQKPTFDSAYAPGWRLMGHHDGMSLLSALQQHRCAQLVLDTSWRSSEYIRRRISRSELVRVLTSSQAYKYLWKQC